MSIKIQVPTTAKRAKKNAQAIKKSAGKPAPTASTPAPNQQQDPATAGNVMTSVPPTPMALRSPMGIRMAQQRQVAEKALGSGKLLKASAPARLGRLREVTGTKSAVVPLRRLQDMGNALRWEDFAATPSSKKFFRLIKDDAKKGKKTPETPSIGLKSGGLGAGYVPGTGSNYMQRADVKRLLPGR